MVLVLKEQLRTTWQAAQSNYFVCLSNMKATLSTDILQRWDKALKKGLEKLCLSHRRQWLGNLDISYLIKLFKSETIRPALMGLTFIYCAFCLPQKNDWILFIFKEVLFTKKEACEMLKITFKLNHTADMKKGGPPNALRHKTENI